jgi:uncharacterized lipoprotein YmbA
MKMIPMFMLAMLLAACGQSAPRKQLNRWSPIPSD